MKNSNHGELAAYLADLAHCHPPTREEMKALAWRWINDGDPAARDEMIRRNLRLVVATVKRHVFGKLPYADFVADGNVALIRAVDKWDPARGVRFATYATWWIRQAIWKRLNRSSAPIHVPDYMAQLVARWRAMETQLERELGRSPSDCEVNDTLGLPRMTTRALATALIAMRASVPLHTVQGDDDSGTPLPEIVDTRSAWEDLSRAEQLALVRRLVQTLDPRATRVLTRRFGLDRKPPQPRKEVGRDLGINRESIRLIERGALARLKAALI